MSNNYQQGGGRAPKKPVTNKWEGEGIVRSRTGNDQDEIKFYPFKNGGGAIHIAVAVSKESTEPDDQGRPKIVTTYVPVSVMTNRNINDAQLRAVRPGMKVHVVGELQAESYVSKQTNQRVTRLAVNAFVFEVLEMPQQAYQGAYQPQPQYGAQPQYPAQPQYGGGQPMYPGQPQYGSQPMYPGQPQYQGQPPYGAQPQYQGQPPYTGQPGMQPPQGGGVPPYYQPPQGATGQPQYQGQPQYGTQPTGMAPQGAGPETTDDLPPGTPIHV